MAFFLFEMTSENINKFDSYTFKHQILISFKCCSTYLLRWYLNTRVMDDFKFLAKKDQQLQGLLVMFTQLNNDIRMKFGINECAKLQLSNEK